MKYYRIFVGVVLVIIFLMIYNLFSRLNEVENQLNSISSDQYEILSSVNGQTGHIENVMRDIQREQSWISSISMEVNTTKMDAGQAVAAFEWQIKEFPNDADVSFNYVLGENEDYTTITPEELETGLFQAEAPFEVELEPRWEIMSTIDQDGESGIVIEEQNKIERDRDTTVKYFVSMSHDEVVKSSTAETRNLGHFGTSVYGMLLTDLFIHKENTSVHVTHDNPDQGYSVEKIYLMKYENGEFIEEEELISEDQNNAENYHHPVYFHTDQPIKKDPFSSLVVKVVYENGKIFEKEIYQK